MAVKVACIYVYITMRYFINPNNDLIYMQCKLKLNCSLSANWFIKLIQDKSQEIVSTFTYDCSFADAYQTVHAQSGMHRRYVVILNQRHCRLESACLCLTSILSKKKHRYIFYARLMNQLKMILVICSV